MNEVEAQAKQWLDESPYLIQRDLGVRLRVTSHVVGQLLNHLGLRLNGHPTQVAFEKELVEIDRSGPWPQYKWNERRVTPLLQHVLRENSRS